MRHRSRLVAARACFRPERYLGSPYGTRLILGPSKRVLRAFWVEVQVKVRVKVLWVEVKVPAHLKPSTKNI